MQFKSLPIFHPYISGIIQGFEVGKQLWKLLVFLVIVEGYNWDSIGNLRTKRIWSVINKNDVFKIPVPKNPQILHENIIRGYYAGITVEPMVKKFIIWINIF